MRRIKCIVIEDEPLAAKVVVDYISLVPFLELHQSFRTALEALGFLHEHEVDLIFLDIHLPQLKGMDFLRTLQNPPSIIVTTAYHQYAVEGFDLNVVDYLLKPFAFDRFLTAVNKVRSIKQDVPEPGQTDSIFLNIHKKKVKILFSEIVYIESQREYVKIVTTKKEYISKIGTHEIEKMLPEKLFRRVHRSFIVAMARIDSYSADTVELNGVIIPIGRDYRGVIDLHGPR